MDNKEQIEHDISVLFTKTISASIKYGEPTIYGHDKFIKQLMDYLSQPKEEPKKDDLKAAYYDGYDAAKIDELVHNENVNLWRLRYESQLKALNDLTTELHVYKLNKDFDLDELKEQWIKCCTDNKMNGVIKGWNFFLPHLKNK